MVQHPVSLKVETELSWILAIEKFSEAAHWISIFKSDINDLKKCIQIKKGKNIGRKSSFSIFDKNIWSATSFEDDKN